MEARKLIIAVIGALLLVAVIVIATNAYKAADQRSANAVPTPTPAPEPTMEATSIPTSEPTRAITPAPGPATSKDGPFNMHASINKSDGQCLLTLRLLNDSEAVDASKLSADMSCDGHNYPDVWTPKLMDWCNADNDSMLEQDEIIATIIDTHARKIPQGEPVTITVYNEGEMLQALMVKPS